MADRKHEIGVGLLLVVAMALLAYMALKVGSISGMRDAVHVSAVFDDAAGLKEGAAVAVAGVEVGKVGGLTVDFNKAKVELALDRKAQIREDVRVVIRARSVLGEKYVELVPVSSDAPLLASGAVLTNTTGQLEIDQFVTGLKPFMDALSPDDVDALLVPLIAALQDDPERPKRMMGDAEALLHNLRVASEDAPATVEETRDTLRQARGLIQEIRPVIDQTDALLTRADGLVEELEATAQGVRPVTDKLPGLIDETESTVADAHRLMETLQSREEQLGRVLDNIEEIDKWELRRLLREEGIKVRFTTEEVQETD